MDNHIYNEHGICTVCGETEDTMTPCRDYFQALRQDATEVEITTDCDACHTINTVYRVGSGGRCSYCGKFWRDLYVRNK